MYLPSRASSEGINWTSFQGCFDRIYTPLGTGDPLQCSCLEKPMDRGAWWAAVHGVTKSRTRLSDFTFTFHFHALGKEMATHSSVLAWRIPGTAEPGGLPSLGSHRVVHDWSDLAAAATIIQSNGQIFKDRSGLETSHNQRLKAYGNNSVGRIWRSTLRGITEPLGDQPLRFVSANCLCNLPHDCSKLQWCIIIKTGVGQGKQEMVNILPCL